MAAASMRQRRATAVTASAAQEPASAGDGSSSSSSATSIEFGIPKSPRGRTARGAKATLASNDDACGWAAKMAVTLMFVLAVGAALVASSSVVVTGLVPVTQKADEVGGADGAAVRDDVVSGADPRRLTTAAAATTATPQERRKGRFPLYGTPEYTQMCPWTATPPTISNSNSNSLYDCTLLARPTPTSNEGLSTWTAEIVAGHVYATQAGCRLVLDYGPGVDVGEVFRRPQQQGGGAEDGGAVHVAEADGAGAGKGNGHDDNVDTTSDPMTDWSIPNGYECKRSEGCFHVGLRNARSVDFLARDVESVRQERVKEADKMAKEEARRRRNRRDDKDDVEKKNRGEEEERGQKQKKPLKPPLMYVPHYRNAFNPIRDNDEEQSAVRTLESSPSLSGFRFDIGMACSLGRLFELSPMADKYVPSLHGTILPALRDDEAFVVAIYIRTGNTDQMAREEKAEREAAAASAGADGAADGDEKKASNKLDRSAVGDAKDERRLLSSTAKSLIRCALVLEEDQVVVGPYSRSVWMVITDSPSVGRAVVATYGGANVTTSTTTSTDKDGEAAAASSATAAQSNVQRTVLTTSTRGIQTRPTRSPQTAEFAEAAIDWFLLGESDAVVSSSGYTFAATGALRTARPFYVTNNGCERRRVVPTTPTVRRGEQEGNAWDFGSELKDLYEFKDAKKGK